MTKEELDRLYDKLMEESLTKFFKTVDQIESDARQFFTKTNTHIHTNPEQHTICEDYFVMKFIDNFATSFQRRSVERMTNETRSN